MYTGSTSDNITVTISEGNVISATAKIDPVSGNALVSSANGLKVDISGKMDTIADATGSQIPLTTATGGISESGYTIQSSGDMGSSDSVVPTANLIAAAITAAVNSSLTDKVDKVVGVVGNFVGFAAEGALAEFCKKAGGATLNEAPRCKYSCN